MNIDDLTIGEARQLAALFQTGSAQHHPIFDGPVVAQFIGRFVFVCELAIRGGYCYLTQVRNIRYWSSREDGIGGLAKNGPVDGDKIDNWPDQVIPSDKLGPVMAANKDKW